MDDAAATAELERRKHDKPKAVGKRLSDRAASVDHGLALIDSLTRSIANTGDEIRRINVSQAA